MSALEEAYRRDPSAFKGAVETRPFESAALRGNALGDPHVREVPVYLPPAALDGQRPVSYTHLTLPTTPYV